MASLSLIFCLLFLLQGTWGSPAKTTVANSKDSSDTNVDKTNAVKLNDEKSFGTQLSSNMNENLMKVMDNLRTGVVEMSTPPVKFGMDVVPDLFTSGFKTMADSATKIVEANKKGFRKLFNGAGSLLGGGAVLGSSIVGGNMQILGSGLGVAGQLVEAAAKFGLDITGNLADTTVLSNKLFTTITKDILFSIGGGLTVAGDGVTILSKGSAKLIDAIGHSISKSIGNAQDTMSKWFKVGSAKIEDGTMTLTTEAQVQYYNALQWYLHNLMAMEGIMDKLTETINPSVISSTTEKSDGDTAADETKAGDKTKADKTEADATKTDASDKADATKAGDAAKTDATEEDEATKVAGANEDDATKVSDANKALVAAADTTAAVAATDPSN